MPDNINTHGIAKKHPKSLIVLFSTEMWERYAFYAVQSILILYLIHHLKFTDQFSYLIMGAIGALIYLTPVAGGVLADRVLGYPAAIIGGRFYYPRDTCC